MQAVKKVFALCMLFSTVLFSNTVSAERLVIVSFKDATLTVLSEKKEPLLITQVVLPRRNYYPVPVSGTVRHAQMGPHWIPTDNMHREFPGKYQKVYRPYEAGNAMGHCQIAIDFDERHPILNYVRIHGNAQPPDLGNRRSRGCIRIPNDLCKTLTSAITTYQGKVRVQFQE